MIPDWFRAFGLVVLTVFVTLFLVAVVTIAIAMVAGVINGLREEYRDRRKKIHD